MRFAAPGKIEVKFSNNMNADFVESEGLELSVDSLRLYKLADLKGLGGAR